MPLAHSVGTALKVLAVSPFENDHESLRSIFNHSTWTLLHADRLSAASTALKREDIHVVVCERDLVPGTWKDLLQEVNGLAHPPSLIVTSRLADERLWAEALNLGAWDVLAKPFDPTEVLRSMKSGWQHWRYRIQLPSLRVRVAS